MIAICTIFPNSSLQESQRRVSFLSFGGQGGVYTTNGSNTQQRDETHLFIKKKKTTVKKHGACLGKDKKNENVKF